MMRFLKPNVDAESNDPVRVMPDGPEIEIALIVPYAQVPTLIAAPDAPSGLIRM